ncbi:MAG: 1-acyl-sn-glycerol-3-phosphate acyltransferase, partial [Lachnospiraceae bacterium]|nr:1-acyl-sn-glycerol-3-phosphate acyltransferase [Lachnospiraceae bacterium]
DGSFKLATKTGCAIVPVAIKNTDKVIGHHFAWFSPTRVSIVYGEPIYPKDIPTEEKRHIGAYMQKKVEEMLENMN